MKLMQSSQPPHPTSITYMLAKVNMIQFGNKDA